MSEINEKIDKIFQTVFEMRPMLADVREGQKATEARLRASEVTQAEHGVKIDRLQIDLDGLGRKVRGVETRTAASPRADRFSWGAIIEFFSAAPTFLHFAVTAGIGLGALAAALWRHHP